MIRLAGLASMLVEKKLSEFDFETFKSLVDVKVSNISMDYDLASGGLVADVSITSKKDAPFRYKYNKKDVSVETLPKQNKIDMDGLLKTIYKTDFSKKSTSMK